jgi:hypothetical protein
VETVLRDYLAREWAAREGVSVEAGIEIFGHSGKRLSAERATSLASYCRLTREHVAGPMAFRNVAVPQQDNFCDCGLFLIEFARRFCLHAPSPHLSLRPEDGWPYMMTPSWFAPEDAGDAKRDAIRAEVLALARGGSGDAAAADAAGAGPATAPAPAPSPAPAAAAAVEHALVDEDEEDDTPLARTLLLPAVDAAADDAALEATIPDVVGTEPPSTAAAATLLPPAGSGPSPMDVDPSAGAAAAGVAAAASPPRAGSASPPMPLTVAESMATVGKLLYIDE